MAVNVGQRNVPLNYRNNMLYATDQARELAIHTIIICSNKNIFDPKYEKITMEIIRIALSINKHAYKASEDNIPISLKKVRKQISKAIKDCTSLLSLIDISKKLYHLRSKKVKYWIKMTLNTRKLLIRWYNTSYSSEE